MDAKIIEWKGVRYEEYDWRVDCRFILMKRGGFERDIRLDLIVFVESSAVGHGLVEDDWVFAIDLGCNSIVWLAGIEDPHSVAGWANDYMREPMTRELTALLMGPAVNLLWSSLRLTSQVPMGIPASSPTQNPCCSAFLRFWKATLRVVQS